MGGEGAARPAADGGAGRHGDRPVIEDSTRLTERPGDQRWLELLEVHDAIVREHLRAHGGYEVKSQGDEFMLAFSSARDAAACAVDIQRALARRTGEGELPLRVRMGLHTGEAMHRHGDSYGRAVILAARIADRAHGGEILVSSLVRELLDPAGDVPIREAEEVELKASRVGIAYSGWCGRRRRAPAIKMDV